MIVVKVEMWPHGDESRKYDLAYATIANVGGDAQVGDYQYRGRRRLAVRSYQGIQAQARRGQASARRARNGIRKGPTAMNVGHIALLMLFGTLCLSILIAEVKS